MEFIFNEDKNNHLNHLKSFNGNIDKMVVISPFLSSDIDSILKQFSHLKKVELFTNLDGFGEAASVVKSLACLYRYCNEKTIELDVKYNNYLHGKAYLLYEKNKEKGMIVTSANFTENGLEKNIEFGISIIDAEKQKAFYNDILSMNFISLDESKVNMLFYKAKEYEKRNEIKHQDTFRAYRYLTQPTYHIEIQETMIQNKINEYKKDFPRRFSKNEYLWKAVKTFQANWNIEAADFSEMFEKATKDADHLLNRKSFQPRKYIIENSKTNQAEMKMMFEQLFNENLSLDDRISEFVDEINSYGEKSSHEEMVAISTYLWLMYPDRYYFYKWAVITDVAKQLGAETLNLLESYTNKLIWSFELLDAIRAYLLNDLKLQYIVKKELSENGYNDDSFHCVTIDFCFMIHSLYAKSKDPMRRN